MGTKLSLDKKHGFECSELYSRVTKVKNLWTISKQMRHFFMISQVNNTKSRRHVNHSFDHYTIFA